MVNQLIFAEDVHKRGVEFEQAEGKVESTWLKGDYSERSGSRGGQGLFEWWDKPSDNSPKSGS